MTTARKLPPIEYLRERLAYDPATGDITWKPHPRLNNRCKPNGIAGCMASGYRVIQIKGVLYRAHRIAYAIHHGVDPIDHGADAEVDHINGDTSDNRIANLRIVTRTENNRNQKRRSDNTSGHLGVCWNKQRGKWQAQVQINGKNKNLGLFNSIDDAVAAREAANKKYEFHPNHGRRAS